ncbi:MAG: hypothetical protein JW395_1029 [Nitrospira sp.]|nr:hypothetical protein [Nitrospira sp.]
MNIVMKHSPPKRLDFLRNRLYVARSLVPMGFEWYFIEQARYTSAHTSTAIEGSALSDTQAMLVLVEGADESKPDEVGTSNLNEAYEIVGMLAGDPSTRLDEGLIRTMNSISLRGLPDSEARNRGKYRTTPNLIVDSETRAVRYRPPDPQFVPELMQSLVKALEEAREENVPGPVLAAMAHFGLISIHPFDDGNGRTARLIADLVLQLTGWAADGMLSISKSIYDVRSQYYEVLREAQGEDFLEEVDIAPFLDFHMEVMIRAATRLEERVAIFRQSLNQFQKAVSGVVNPRQAMGLSILLDMGMPLSSTQYAKMNEVSQSSAVSDLNEMVRKGLVTRIGTGKSTRYVIDAEIKRKADEAAALTQANKPI